MTLTEFSKIAESKLSEKVISFIMCIIAILLASFLFIKFSEIKMGQNNWLILGFIYIIAFLFISLGFYGLVILSKPLKVKCLENKIPKTENLKLIEKIYYSLNGKEIEIENDTVKFTFKESFWSYKQRISFLAQDNLIAVYVKNIDSNPKESFLDFGARARIQKKVLNMLEQTSR